jgi:hypothetical protein
MTPAFCLHCHFHQSPRGAAARSGFAESEAGAEPYNNFNAKALDLCYRPNAALGNFDRMSFDVGPDLLGWLRRADAQVFTSVAGGAANALAAPEHHTILPLARRRDKLTQVAWGLASFAHHFGRPAEGLWLPEMAVDLETLETLAARGVQFTVLSQAQVLGPVGEGAGAYWVNLGGGHRIAVYVRDDALSNQLAFELPSLGGAGRWARGTLGPRRRSAGRLALIATDGQTFGFHHRGEEHFLHWLLAYEVHAVGYELTSLAQELRANPPRATVEIVEFTSWNCPHGPLRRWATGCDCTPGDSGWKGALRRALDEVASTVDELYVTEVASAGADPWALRDSYIQVLLGQATGPELLREHGLAALTEPATARILSLLEAVDFRQRMYASSAFFHEDLARAETRFAIASAARALQRLQQATGQDFLPALRSDLSLAAAADGRTGAAILDEVRAEQSS